MIVSIHQPQFLPWLGYFAKIAQADTFVFLDDCQYKKNEWQNRNRIKTAQGPQWLTVPVAYHFPEKITEVKVNNDTDWKKNHINAIKTNYSKAPYFDEVFGHFSDLYSRNWEYLVDLNLATVQRSLEYLGITVKTIRSSEMKTEGASTERLITICRGLNADTYLAGAGGKEYMDTSLFENANIKVVYQEFAHPVYPQLFGSFEPCMCVLDLFFNCGKQSRDILLKNS